MWIKLTDDNSDSVDWINLDNASTIHIDPDAPRARIHFSTGDSHSDDYVIRSLPEIARIQNWLDKKAVE